MPGPLAKLPRDELRRMIRFSIIGLSNTAVALVAYSLVVFGLGAGYLLGAVAAYAVAILNGYTWNRSWTFETGAFHTPEFLRYVAVNLVGLGMNSGMLSLLVESAGLGRLLAYAISLIPVIVVTFVLNRFWTFREVRTDPGAEIGLGP
jgi:putative flippase GtrA